MKLTQVVKVEGNYEILDNLAKITNGLYNSALYEINQRYRKEQKFYFYYDLCNILYNKQFNADAGGALNIRKRYLQIPLQQGSSIGVVGVLAHPAVYRWNEHRWCNGANG